MFADDSLQPWPDRDLDSFEWSCQHVWQPHHASHTLLMQAASDECYICSHILRKWSGEATGIMYRMRLRRLPGEPDLKATVTLSPTPYTRWTRIPQDPSIFDINFDVTLLAGRKETIVLSKYSLQQSHTGSAQCVALISSWLRECLDCHNVCSSTSNKLWYPTRLLFLSAETARLVETAEHHPTGSYATLSHSWGTHPIDVLTPVNRTAFVKGRLVKDLPATFRQCCELLLRMDVKYVWIDTFCILQGSSTESEADWNREACLMQHVYSNSLLNICASVSTDSRGGLFRQRPDSVQHPVRLRWKPTSEDGMQAFALSARGPPFADYVFNQLHLFSRAWVAQERVLSPRIVYFAYHQTWWQGGEEGLLSETYARRKPHLVQLPKALDQAH